MTPTTPLTPEMIAELRALLAKARIEGPVEADPNCLTIIHDAKQHRVADIRGWGRLTGNGHGGLGLSETEAFPIQDARGLLFAAAINHLPALLDAAERSSGRGSH